MSWDSARWRTEVEEAMDLPIGSLPPDLIDAVYTAGIEHEVEFANDNYDRGHEEGHDEGYEEGWLTGKQEMWDEIRSQIDYMEP